MTDIGSVHGVWVEWVVLTLSRFLRAEAGNGEESGRRTAQDREVRCEAYGAGQVQRPRVPIPKGYMLAYHVSTRACLPQ